MALRAQAGAGEGIRTPDPLITNQMLYRLSYASRANLIIVPERTQNCKGNFLGVALAVQEFCWVHRGIFYVYLVMEVRSGSLAGHAHRADDLPAFKDLTDHDEDLA